MKRLSVNSIQVEIKLTRELAARLMRRATAPFFEHATYAEVLAICAEHGLPVTETEHGNLLVRWNNASKARPLVLAAHLDHPGFEIVRRLGPKRWVAQFNGGVGDAWFRRGTLVRLEPGATPARLGRRVAAKGRKRFELVATRMPQAAPQFAVWELEDFAARGGRIHGRACDDLIGCACVLATMIELKRRHVRVNVIGALSRAEEVGFHGALTLAATRAFPQDALVISLETSKELSPVEMGRGVILRVGDKASTFNAAAMRYLALVAEELGERKPGFRHQRALMGGGTCEATAYQEFGYTVAAVCVALGNYHNCGPRNRIIEEFVSLSDAGAMTALLVEAARALPRYEPLANKLPTRLNGLLRKARARLRRLSEIGM